MRLIWFESSLLLLMTAVSKVEGEIGESTKSDEMFIEVEVVADRSVRSYHENDTLLFDYIAHMMGVVADVYSDLKADLHVVLVNVSLVEEHVLDEVEEAKKALTKANLHMANKSDMDVAVWLTRVQLGGASGLAPLNGICDHRRRSTLIRDDGLKSAFVIAHELGHLLGLSHDDEECGVHRGSIMNQVVDASSNSFHWSSCSRRQFESKISSLTTNYSCLQNRPVLNERRLERRLFTLDEQCQLEFGKDHNFCTAFDVRDVCEHLWCSEKGGGDLCKQKGSRPMEGSECGERRRCHSSRCLDDIRWVVAKWEQCTHSCGNEGEAFRNVVCVNHALRYHKFNQWIVHPSQCRRQSGPAPSKTKPCNRHPCTMPSMNISRHVTQKIEDDNQELNTNKRCMTKKEKDVSVLCREKVMMRYCLIPSYRALCCRSCRKHYKRRISSTSRNTHIND